METKTEVRGQTLALVFGLVLFVTLAGIICHRVTGYHYPVSPAFSFEINVLGDIYEAFLLVPVGLVGLWLLRMGSPWGPLLIAGMAANLTYNYAMVVTGRQNLWIFFWIVKLALSGTTVCLAWSLLPSGPSRLLKQRFLVMGYLVIVLLVFSRLMGQRLLASASGRAVDMSMREIGALDWGEPFLRDPIVFFSLACPVTIAAILGLWRGADWGARAASLSSVWILSILTLILFTGPLKEFLQTGSISGPMLGMSAIMVIAAIPAVWSLIWLVTSRTRR